MKDNYAEGASTIKWKSEWRQQPVMILFAWQSQTRVQDYGNILSVENRNGITETIKY